MLPLLSAAELAATRAEQPLLLALGVLPSDNGDWRTAAANRRAARRTWLAPPLPHGFAYQFAVSQIMKSATTRPQRRRLSEPQPPRGTIARERLQYGNDLIVLQLPIGSLCTCAERTHAWFSHALARWPSAAYIGKTEVDILVGLPPLMFELSRLPLRAQPLLWWGLFVWTGSADADLPKPVGCWGGGFEDDPMLTQRGTRQTLGKERGCPEGARPLAPAPTHEMDIRSTALATSLKECSYPRKWLQWASAGGAAKLRRCPNDCAAVQGE